MDNVLEFQIPWYFIFWMSLLFCGISTALLKRFSKAKKNHLFGMSCVVALTVLIGSTLFSYTKFSKINQLIDKGRLVSIQGSIDKVEHFNGKDIVFLGGESFEIKHHDLYCVSGKKVLSGGEDVSLSYVDLERWAGFIDGNCIIDLKIN